MSSELTQQMMVLEACRDPPSSSILYLWPHDLGCDSRSCWDCTKDVPSNVYLLLSLIMYLYYRGPLDLGRESASWDLESPTSIGFSWSPPRSRAQAIICGSVTLWKCNSPLRIIILLKIQKPRQHRCKEHFKIGKNIGKSMKLIDITVECRMQRLWSLCPAWRSAVSWFL